jgi:hypothetical protein
MGTISDDRALYLAAGVVVLADVEVEGRPLRFARVPVVVDLADGTTAAYGGGLEIGQIDDGLGSDNRTAGVTLRAADGFWATLASRGVVLEGTRIVLSLWSDGGTPVPFFRGHLTGATWADPGDVNALVATADATPYGAGATIPSADQVVSDLTWPVDTNYTVDTAVYGAYYPRIYGQPGNLSDVINTFPAPGSPVLLTEFSSSGLLAPDIKMLVAGHKCTAATCTIIDASLPFPNFETAVTVRETADLLGRTVSYVRGGDFSGGFGGIVEGHNYYAAWVDDASPGGLGAVLLDLLRSSGLPVDLGRCNEQATLLDVYAVDACINAPTDPLAWIRANILPIFPVSIALGPSGWYFYALRSDVTDRDVIAIFDADNQRVTPASPVQTTPWASIVNRLTLRYGFRIDVDQPRAMVYVDERERAPSFGLATHLGCVASRASVTQPWGPRSATFASRAIGRAATARNVALDYVARNAFPTQRRVYTSGPEHTGIYPGAYVLVRDAAAGWVGRGRLCRVVSRSVIPGGSARSTRVAHTVATLGASLDPRGT